MAVSAIALTPGPTPRAAPPRVLMIYPRFNGGSFWSFEETCRLYGCEWTMPPLGLATVAAMLPADWDVRLLDRNIEAVADADILAADLVMTGGMLPQRPDTLGVVARARRLGRPVVVGGPDVMSSPDVYAAADFRVTGEAEGLIDAFVAAWRDGATGGRFDAERFKADVTASPTPRFDLIKAEKYTQMTVQFSRGCPFTCEFCDIIELFGRNPRTKTTPQILAELDAIYALGYRGHVNFVDDNLIGNKKAVRLFLPHLIEWQKKNGWPFDFSTEASLNLADDTELMRLMSAAGFLGVFVGIESPDEDVLAATKKKQNTRRNIAESVHKIYAAGLGVMAGFIVGFDEESGEVGDAIADLIEEAAIPIAMAGLLYALPETALSRRLAKEGRLHETTMAALEAADGTLDQCTQGLNFDTQRPRAEILRDFRTVVARTYDLAAYHGRIRRMASLMRFTDAEIALLRSGMGKNLRFFLRLCWRLGVAAPEGKRLYWGTLLHAVRHDTRSLEAVFLSLAAWTSLGPFSREVLKTIDRKIVASERETAFAVAAE